MEGVLVSIIVPTYNDWKRLQKCLQALEAQKFSKDNFEIIVVNNNPQDKVPENFILPSNAKIITEAKPGSYAARNTALHIAQGAIIGFTDSDCLPEPNWIQNALAYLAQHKNCHRVAGPVKIFSRSNKPAVAELYDQTFAFPQKQYVKNGAGVTANLFTYRFLFDKVGPFNELLFSNGDLEWGRAATEAGFTIRYVPNVVIRHPARNLKGLIQKERRKGGGRGMAERKWNNKLKNLFRLVNGMRPRLSEIKHIKKAAHLGPLEKLKVVLLRHYLLQVRALEHLRVQLGKRPNRA